MLSENSEDPRTVDAKRKLSAALPILLIRMGIPQDPISKQNLSHANRHAGSLWPVCGPPGPSDGIARADPLIGTTRVGCRAYDYSTHLAPDIQHTWGRRKTDSPNRPIGTKCRNRPMWSMPEEPAPRSAFAARGQRAHTYADHAYATHVRKERARNARPDASVSPVHIARARTTSGHRTPFARVSLGRVSAGSTHETVPRMQARRGLLENSDSIAPIVAVHEKSLASAPSRTPEVLTCEHLTCARLDLAFTSE